MIYRVDRVSCGSLADGEVWMETHVWQQMDDGEVLVRHERACRCGGKWLVTMTGGVVDTTETPTLDMYAIADSQELRKLAWREGEVEFAVERHPDTGKAEIYVQARLAL